MLVTQAMTSTEKTMSQYTKIEKIELGVEYVRSVKPAPFPSGERFIR